MSVRLPAGLLLLVAGCGGEMMMMGADLAQAGPDLVVVAADLVAAADGAADLAGAPDAGGDGATADLLAAPDLTPPVQRFAVIGDYGVDSQAELDVSKMVKGWAPDFIVTTGDNNYPNGERSTIDRNIGKYYAQFIGGYMGQYGPGSMINRFFPTIGNHEYYGPEKLQPYLDYFPQLPGNRRYYDIVIGRVHLFAVNSGEHMNLGEPDGNDAGSKQAMWLKQGLAASKACYKIVAFHFPGQSSGEFALPHMKWPFKDWGADVVLAGHEHYYERLDLNGLAYFINGLGGANYFMFKTPIPESKVRFTGNWGAQLGTVTPTSLTLDFWSIDGKKQDSFTMNRNCP